jgi:hypothetical protein
MTNIYAGWRLQTAIQSGSAWTLLDGVQRVTYKLLNNIESKEECGTRFVTLVEGSYGLNGTIERFYTGSGSWNLFSVGNSVTQTWNMRIYPAGASSGSPYIELGGIKFNDIELLHRPMANPMTETWTFLGTGSVANGTLTGSFT